MRLSPRLALLALLAPFAGFVLFALADPQSPEIEGMVRDENGPVAGARVRLKGAAISADTDADGRFHLPHLPRGRRVTAWKEGYFIGGGKSSSSLSIHLKRLPLADAADYEWVDPAPSQAEVGNCANCHAEIYREWSASGHSRSVGGRHFRNLYEGTDWNGKPGVGWGLLTQHPDGGGVCASCHAPTASSYDLRKVEGVAARGVHCDYCHKIADVGDGSIGLTHGRFNLRLSRPAEGQRFNGPLDDVDRGEDAYSPLFRESRYCASCHEGVVFGVHVYSTYSEWLRSPARRAGKQCQDCHMKPTGRMANFAPGRGGIERDPRTLANHRFFDGDQQTMLSRAVKASASFERGPNGVRARVRLWAEGVGHRLPTGFIDRHLVLVVEGQGPDGKTLPARQGPTLPELAGRELAGQSGRLFARILKDFDGHSPTAFWLASPDPPPDTRLKADQAEEIDFEFPPNLARVRVRVLYRRFWPETARVKGWPPLDLLVLDRAFLFPIIGR